MREKRERERESVCVCVVCGREREREREGERESERIPDVARRHNDLHQRNKRSVGNHLEQEAPEIDPYSYFQSLPVRHCPSLGTKSSQQRLR